jgi:hypothetical protein
MIADTIPAPPPTVPTMPPLVCPECDGEGSGDDGPFVAATYWQPAEGGAWTCSKCDGTGRVPCYVCDARDRPAVERIDGDPLCADCARWVREDMARDYAAVPCVPVERPGLVATRLDRQLWARLDARVKLHLLARGLVSIDANGHPIISGDVAALVVQDLVRAMRLPALGSEDAHVLGVL